MCRRNSSKIFFAPQFTPGDQAHDEETDPRCGGPGNILVTGVARQQSVANLAGMLHQYNDMPVVDGTGMADKFDFTLEYSVGLAASPDAEPGDAPDLSRALKQQLGLQIVRRKTPFDFVVVESVDRLPTEN